MNNIDEKKTTIIFADDDEDLLRLVKIKLTAEGFLVKVSLNGERISAIAAVEKPDVILLDVTMQGVDGRDLCRSLKNNKETSSIPVILISANENLENIADSCGADGYVKKPFDVQAVRKKIESVLVTGIRRNLN